MVGGRGERREGRGESVRCTCKGSVSNNSKKGS